jgi:hypothetical protein
MIDLQQLGNICSRQVRLLKLPSKTTTRMSLIWEMRLLLTATTVLSKFPIHSVRFGVGESIPCTILQSNWIIPRDEYF